MSSVHRDPRGKSRFWYAAFTGPDGKRHFKSTKCTTRSDAEDVADSYEQAARLAKIGRLTPTRARDIVHDAVATVMRMTGQDLPATTVRAWAKDWLQCKKLTATVNTYVRYEGTLGRFLEWLGHRADKHLECITPAEIAGFRDHLVRTLSVSSANTAVKIVRAYCNAAVKCNLLTSNPATKVEKIKDRRVPTRRAFKLDELRRVLDKCGPGEWRGLVLMGLYTGQRIGDISKLTWRSLDLERNEISYSTQKTGKALVIPIAKPLLDYILAQPAPDNPDAPLFPKSAGLKRIGTLSNQFHDILVDAGLATKRKVDGKGQRAPRITSAISFHSLRHTATSLLKAAGAGEAVAMAIIGHDSTAVSRAYTHIEADHMRAAIDRLPDVTAAKEK